MELENIRCFVQLAEELNFAKAAERMHISQSTMSRRIEGMEQELDVLLFNRDSKKVQLTNAGKEFYFQASKLLEQYNGTVELVRNVASGFQRELRVGIGFYEQFFLGAFLKDFIKKYPKIKITLYQFVYRQLLEQFIRSNLDIILTSDQFLSSENSKLCEKQLLWDKEWCLLLHKDHPLVPFTVLKRGQLKGQILISMHDGSVDQIRNIYKEQMFLEPFRDIIHVNSYEAKLTLVNAGVGIGFIPTFVQVKNYGDVVKRMLDPRYVPRKFYIMCKSDVYSDTVRDFMQMCVKGCKSL